MLNLTLHCGAQAVDRAQVDQCVTPSPTNTWQPIPHAHLLDLIMRTLTATGMQIVNQAHALSREGSRYFGLMEVQNSTDSKTLASETSGGGVSGGGGDYGFVVGVRNSHDQSFPAGLVVGSGVFICDNLAFSGEIVLARKHTRFIVCDLPLLVDRAVGQLGDLRVQQDQRIEAYKNMALTDRRVHDLLIQCLDSQILPITRLPAALQEWRKPQHDNFRGRGRSA